jgi:hypothetical protein
LQESELDFALAMAKCVYLSKKHHFGMGQNVDNQKKALNVHSEPFFDALLALKK